jgi:hypothetical protein
MRYRLERRDGIRGVPQWALVGGTAFHECIREWETEAASPIGTRTAGRTPDEQAERFGYHFANATAETQLANLDHPLATWRASGRSSAAYPNKEDRGWWLDKGPEMVAQYVQAQEGREYEILRLDAEALALEWGFMLRLDGLPPVKGFIDQVLYFPRTDAVIVRDLKSGAQIPQDQLQVKVYSLALRRCFGIDPPKMWGDYWDARKGVATKGVDLSDVARVEAEVRYRVAAMDTAETLNLYPPNPSNLCSSCGVRKHCPAMSDEPTASWSGSRPALDAPVTRD